MSGVDAAREFIQANGRVLDQRLAAVVFDGAEPSTVVNALVAYRNPDGGFGHGLEPDKRVPASQPLDVEIAFEYLAEAGAGVGTRADAPEIVTAACDWLVTVTDPAGAVPVLLPSIRGYPRAAHWEPIEYTPGLNPTAAIAAHALALDVPHPWIERATEYSLGELETGRVPNSAISLLTMAKLVEVVPDRQRAEVAAGLVEQALSSATWLKLDPETDDYGVTPLDFAPDPSRLARGWFGDELIESHLDQLERDQEPDGGWPLSWTPPSDASRWEWRAIRTLAALRTLAAYGRVRL